MIQIPASIISVILIVLLSWYLLHRKGRTFPDYMLFGALACAGFLELFGLMATLHPENLIFWKRFTLLAEGCLPPLWLLYSLTFARERELKCLPLLQRILVCVSLFSPPASICLFVASISYFPGLRPEKMFFLAGTEFCFYFCLFTFLVISLINLEATLTGASFGASRKFKLEIVGTGTMLAVLIFWYSQGLFYRSTSLELLPVRSAVFIIAVALMAYSRLIRGRGVSVKVSSQMVYNSVVLLAVAVYLLGLGLLGEGTRYFGSSFNRSLQITVAFLFGIALIILLLSRSLRRRAMVFLRKNFYEHKYDYRVQWLQFTNRLVSARNSEEFLRAVLTAFVETFGMGYGAMFLYDRERAGYCGVSWLELSPTSGQVDPGEPFVRYMEETKRVVNAGDPTPGVPEGFCDNNRLDFIVPLISRDSLEGFIVLGRSINPEEIYNFEDYDLMKTLAHQAISGILNLRLAEQLCRSQEMEAVGRIAAFLVHDLKNLASSISMVVENAKENMDNLLFRQNMLQTLTSTVAKMQWLIMRLKGVGKGEGCGKRTQMDLLEVVERAVSPLAGKGVQVVGTRVASLLNADEIQKVVLNLVLNAVEACEGNGRVMVEVGEGEAPYFTVTDNGCGMTQDYLANELFKPFRTTKKKGLGVGLFQCRQIIDSHGGRIQVESVVSVGSKFTVLLPPVAESRINREEAFETRSNGATE